MYKKITSCRVLNGQLDNIYDQSTFNSVPYSETLDSIWTLEVINLRTFDFIVRLNDISLMQLTTSLDSELIWILRGHSS